MLSRFSRTQLFATLWTVTYQAPLSIGFSRQEYWNGLPCPPPGDLPSPGIEPASLVSPALAGRFFTSELPGKPLSWENWSQISVCSTIVGEKQFPLKGKHRPYEQRWQGLLKSLFTLFRVTFLLDSQTGGEQMICQTNWTRESLGG